MSGSVTRKRVAYLLSQGCRSCKYRDWSGEGEVNKGGTPELDMMTAYDAETEEKVSELSCEFVNCLMQAADCSRK